MSDENKTPASGEDLRRMNREIASTLITVNVCVRNVCMYGRFHPIVEECAATAYRSITDLLASNTTISIGVTEFYVAYGSFPVEDRGGALSNFAKSLFERKVSEIIFHFGLKLEELIDFAEAISLSTGDLLLRGGIKSDLERRGVVNIAVKSGFLPAESRVARDAADIYEEALFLVEGAMRAVQTGLMIDVGDIRAVVSDSLQSLIGDESAILALAGVRSYDRYLSEHCVNVCVLSMILAKDLGLDLGTVMEIGVGALLHDVGKVFIPSEIITKPGRLTPEEWEAIKRHPFEGARALAGLPDLPALAPTIALEHHMHCDGSGYPNIPGREAHLVSRLVAIVDTYDALTTDRPYRERWLPSQAIGWMLYEAWPQYDRQLLARFASKVNLCPVGSLIRLNNGELATVVGGSHEHPTKPVIKIINGSTESDGWAKIVDLNANTDPQFEIAAVAQPAEVLLQYADLLATA